MDAGVGERPGDDAVDGGLARLAREVGDDAAPGSVDFHLRGEGLAEDAAVAGDDGGAGVVAAGLDAKHEGVRADGEGAVGGEARGGDGRAPESGGGRRANRRGRTMGRGGRARGEPAAEEPPRARTRRAASPRPAAPRHGARHDAKTRAADAARRASQPRDRGRAARAHRDANCIPEFENASGHARRAGEGERRGRGAGDDVTTRTSRAAAMSADAR